MDDLERRSLLSAAGLVGIAAIARSAKAGPLDPPPGPVAPTGRTLDEIYNRIPGTNGSGDGRIAIPANAGAVAIGAPGSYVLTGNIALSAGTPIFINASNVTVDLNGYTVSTGAAANVHAIEIAANLSNIRIRNGAVIGGDSGIRVGACNGVIIEDMLIARPRSAGISCEHAAAAIDYTIRRCVLRDIGAGSTSSDSFNIVYGIEASINHVNITDNTVNRFFYSGSFATPFFYGIYAYGPGSEAVFLARNSVAQIAPTVTNGAGIACGGGTYRDNTVYGFNTKYQTIAFSVNGGGNV